MATTSRNSDQMVIRLHPGMRNKLKDLAKARHRSMTGQVAAMLEDAIGAEKEMAPGQP